MASEQVTLRHKLFHWFTGCWHTEGTEAVQARRDCKSEAPGFFSTTVFKCCLCGAVKKVGDNEHLW